MPDRRILAFADLQGWAEDDHEAALMAFRETCARLDGPDWPALCALARDLPPGAARGFFEAAFVPVIVRDGRAPLLSGYYEPELAGSRIRSAQFRHPLYARPPDLPEGRPWLTRRQIEEGRALAGRGLEIAWVSDPVEALFLGIQGSGRVRLAEGGTLRLGFGGANGHERRSIGLEMVRRGLIEPFAASAATIRDWVRENPREGRELLRHDPSFVFFREVEGVAEDRGPLGAMLRPLTPLRSVAVDPAHVPLGAPVWVEKDGTEPMRRLMVAQDTGSAIRGAQRADLFFGTGEEAGRRAGRVRDRGRIVMLLPIRLAHALVPDPMAVRGADGAGAVSGGPPERSPTPIARPVPIARSGDETGPSRAEGGATAPDPSHRASGGARPSSLASDAADGGALSAPARGASSPVAAAPRAGNAVPVPGAPSEEPSGAAPRAAPRAEASLAAVPRGSGDPPAARLRPPPRSTDAPSVAGPAPAPDGATPSRRGSDAAPAETGSAGGAPGADIHP